MKKKDIEYNLQCGLVQTLDKFLELKYWSRLEYLKYIVIPKIGRKPKSKNDYTALKIGSDNKKMGYRSGVPDMTILYKLKNKDPNFLYFEFKASSGVLNANQKLFKKDSEKSLGNNYYHVIKSKTNNQAEFTDNFLNVLSETFQ